MTIDSKTRRDYEKLSAFDASRPVRLCYRDGVPEAAHLFDTDCIVALQSALAARRPLLLKGEPGVGKTQLAAAAARILQRPLVTFVIDSRAEATDLKWSFDSVRRLAEAQLCGAMPNLDDAAVAKRLDIKRFVTPGPLWWGFDWSGAEKHASKFGLRRESPEKHGNPENGCVVLIDEIDKADSDVPNGLLEALGSGEFTPEGCDPVTVDGHPPLVIVTTNEERSLPDAFVRRCLVLRMSLPEHNLLDYLVMRGKAHFRRTDENDDEFCGEELDESVIRDAAQMLIDDRRDAVAPLPGLAEYLDLLRTVRDLAHIDLSAQEIHSQEHLLQSVRRFTLQKHVEQPDR